MRIFLKIYFQGPTDLKSGLFKNIFQGPYGLYFLTDYLSYPCGFFGIFFFRYVPSRTIWAILPHGLPELSKQGFKCNL